MRKIGMYAVVVCALLLALPVAAQEEPGTITRATWWTVKAGMGEQFEEGLKRHNDFHRQQNDPVRLNTFEILTGERAGQYIRVTGGHHWADFDAEEQNAAADAADSAVNLDPYIASGIPRIYNFLPNLSRPRPGGGPSPMAALITFRLKGGRSVPKFMNAISKVNAAARKTNWPVHTFWYVLVNGGEHPTFVLGLPEENWAGFASPEKSLAVMLEDAHGRQEAEMILATFDKTIKSQRSEIVRYRPDLSYIPAGN